MLWTLTIIGIGIGIVLLLRIFFVLSSIRKNRRRKSSSSSSSPPTPAPEPSNNWKQKDHPVKTMVVLGSGGHTTEMLQLIKNLDPKLYTPFVVVVASTDTTSIRRVQAYPNKLPIVIDDDHDDGDGDDHDPTKTKPSSSSLSSSSPSIQSKATKATPTTKSSTVYKIPRSREVGQSYSSSVVTTLYSFWVAMKMVLTERPDLVLVNGPGTCLPVAVSAFVLLRVLCLKPSCRIVFVESFCRVKRYVQ